MDGPQLIFAVATRDEAAGISQGTRRRAVIDLPWFQERLRERGTNREDGLEPVCGRWGGSGGGPAGLACAAAGRIHQRQPKATC